MKWNIKRDRIVKKFALFPIRMDREYRWLETVYIYQQSYKSLTGSIHWRDVRFVGKTRYKQYKRGEIEADGTIILNK